jgi:hypothetical protein
MHSFVVPSIFSKKRVPNKTRQQGFWKTRENRRQFLIDLATSKGLDPFDPNTWKSITKEVYELDLLELTTGKQGPPAGKQSSGA